jgi:hypothetical protein
MNWKKIEIKNDLGVTVEAQAPVIISASRSTDIPAFYADWFMERIRKGYLKWKNPFNGVPLYVSFEQARLIVFWSKNPKPMLQHLDFLNERNINYYFQYTLNDYDNEGIEKGVPKVAERIDTFQKLAERIGKEKVIWRYDPLILTDTVGVDELLRKVEGIGNQLKGYTDKLVFSFADIRQYKKVQTNLDKSTTNYREFDEAQMNEFCRGLAELNQSWNFQLGTCAEPIALEQYGILHNKCIDDDLIIRLFPNDKALMDLLGVKVIAPDIFNPDQHIEKTKNNRDTGQRVFCGCIVSKDIGEYNTCPHQCEYCYANTNPQAALSNYKRFRGNNNSESISGEI